MRTTTGRELTEQVAYYKGHYRNPMTRDDVDAKLDRICDRSMPAEAKERIRSAWWSVADADDIAKTMETLFAFSSRSGGGDRCDAGGPPRRAGSRW